jgi:hypothetical protein
MRFFSLPGAVRRAVLGGLFLFAAMGAASAATPYDGNWSVLIITQSGNCDAGYRYPLKIDNGKVAYAGDGSFAVSGQVGSGGAVNVSISRGDKKASGSGKLTASGGAGKWSGGSPGSACSGRWEAERKS